MMAHELPVPIHNEPKLSPPSTKSSSNNKNKTLRFSDDERRLPNGDKVDFGNGYSKKSSKKITSTTKKSKEKSSDGKLSKNNNLNESNNGHNRKKSNEPSLPNGEKPNFFNDNRAKESSSKSKKKSSIPEPLLPNGEKPNFYNDSSSKSKKKNYSDSTMTSNEKPNSNNDSSSKSNKKYNKTNNKDKKAAIMEETYAGSSFHSSPAALNLPKPSFRTSPKQSSSATVQQGQEPPTQNNKVPSPQYPVTAYPPGSGIPNSNSSTVVYPQHQFIQPGFTYQTTPQGYIHYPYPPHGTALQAPPPPGSYPVVTTHYQQSLPVAVQVQPPMHTNSENQQSGQKISFNDLLGLSKS